LAEQDKKNNSILRVENLSKAFLIRGGIKRQYLHAVSDVSFEVEEGGIFGLVGESGCGKTTIARCLVRLERLTAGKVWFQGEEIGHLSQKAFLPWRKRIQIVFQDPLDSLNPRLSVKKTLLEPLNNNTSLSAQEKMDLIHETMAIVGLREEHLDRFAHQLSTGQQQRVGIARATICNPDFVVLDEPTSALDLSFRGRVLELLSDLQERFGITYIFISHDLGVVRFFSKKTAVMYLGFIVESGPTKELFEDPAHPYTKALISAIPRIDPKSRTERVILKGEVPSPISLPPGCPFNNRCPEAREICSKDRPSLVPISGGRMVACHTFH
jgi:peptide/nickel transport system ATP-binding protein/oligopeptide transport system ATP-binding protein